jgi:predicted RNase H-like HicB family nuclease
LADRIYTTVTTLDETTTGEPRYVAYSVEVKGCIGSGATANFARADLLTARADMFEVMLDDGLTIPEPNVHVLCEGKPLVIDLGDPWKKAQPAIVIGDDEDGQHD